MIRHPLPAAPQPFPTAPQRCPTAPQPFPTAPQPCPTVPLRTPAAAFLLAAVACSTPAAAFLLAAVACSTPAAAVPDATPARPTWDPALPPSATLGERRGLHPARGIIHLHSPYSHDACDGRPRALDGTVDEQCLLDLRAALCRTRIDFAALTDHDDSMADEPWGPELFLFRSGDELVPAADGTPIASRLRCPDDAGDHETLIFVGGENDLMPVLLDHHPPGDVAARHDAYNASDAAAVLHFREQGGLTFVAHTEGRAPGELIPLAPDGVEIFNLHAAIDPDIRRDDLGLDGSEAFRRVIDFADSSLADPPEPDLAFLAFLAENAPSIARWEELLLAGQRVLGTAGTDAHQNALPIILRDGERGDSYRRMLRWFGNIALVTTPGDPVAVEAALAARRTFVVFEVLGTPVGFDFHAATSDGSIVEIGGDAPVGAELVAVTPALLAPDDRFLAPTLTTRLLRVDAAGAVLLAEGTGEVRAAIDRPGVYRAEVRMIPHHLAPLLGTLAPRGYAEIEQVWIYANPIYTLP